MKPGKIRALALALFRHRDRILVFEGHDPAKNETFYRLVGGGIEFGEYGREAVVREVREELGAEIENVVYVATLENIFTSSGETGHEIVLLYAAEFSDLHYYEVEEMVGHEDNDLTFRVLWLPLSFFVEGRAPLYPDGLLDLLRSDEPA